MALQLDFNLSITILPEQAIPLTELKHFISILMELAIPRLEELPCIITLPEILIQRLEEMPCIPAPSEVIILVMDIKRFLKIQLAITMLEVGRKL